MKLAGSSALIVQNKGGGHGELGFHLAKQLRAAGCTVTLLNDGQPTAKPPFDHYNELEQEYVDIVWTDVKAQRDLSSVLKGKTFDLVFDNWSKDEGTVRPIAEFAKKNNVKHYMYVSSGGMYQPTGDEFPILEKTKVKDDSGQRQVEKTLEAMKVPWTSFRPQYIYGPYTNKRDYLDFFFDRVTHGLPIPIPYEGATLTTLTNAEDVASMLISAVGKQYAIGEVFNCASDRYISYEGIVRMVAKTVGKDPSEAVKSIVYYDPKRAALPKGAFPFRNTHFCVNPEKAKLLLDWRPQHRLEDDLKWYFAAYRSLGKLAGQVDTSADAKAIAARA
ncbi:unnamed protein product [Vitrella brassicaformis CCMP3155]|uniref:NAD(P)-binding domain-containing protein n=2 Tax=Vitrella brassicaformis TaxID=1169539 RepID=A0A0G4EVW7_VITBC|nr:unnamed protein product [Vitrella brassicaformis CCMP3155]|eukprot:CEM02236.1 unnamed protein product [Vitrella brassicaformis CCMP3155]